MMDLYFIFQFVKGRCYGNQMLPKWRQTDTTLCLKKNDNDVLRYNFNKHQPILIIFGRDIAEWICY